MASGLRTKVNFSSWTAGLDKLSGSLRESLARSMGVAAARAVRDEARLLVPKKSGALADAIYMAFNENASSSQRIVYSVSWNATKAPHGHLIEFGHWRYNKIVDGIPQHSLKAGRTSGRGPQDHEGPGALETPVWVAAHPFLRPAAESMRVIAPQAAVARGRVRLPELLAQGGSAPNQSEAGA